MTFCIKESQFLFILILNSQQLYQITSSITSYITFNNQCILLLIVYQHSLSLECNISGNSTNNYTSSFPVGSLPFCLSKSFNELCFCTCSLLVLYGCCFYTLLCLHVRLLRGACLQAMPFVQPLSFDIN